MDEEKSFKQRVGDLWVKAGVAINLLGIAGNILVYVFIYGGKFEVQAQDHAYIETEVKPMVKNKYEVDQNLFRKEFDREIIPIKSEISGLKNNINEKFEGLDKRLDRLENMIIESREESRKR